MDSSGAPADSDTAFGVLLRRHRLAMGLTQEALAERAGLSVYGIQKLERGTTHPYRDTALRLADALRLAPEDADRFRAAVTPVRRHSSMHDRVAHDNLPVAPNRFVGREQELAEIPRRLESARLLTLSGVGGSGKTRLALELGRRLAERYRDGVKLIELAELTDAALVPHQVAAILGVRETAKRPLSRALADALRTAHALLVLDNCEHLLDGCAALIEPLLRECPAIRILATSREPIGIPGEVNWAVRSLAVPDPGLAAFVDEMQRSEAVRLFVDRASAAQRTFELTPENAEAVGEICRRVDGLPLALELAAACLDALSPHQLAARLDSRFRLLTSGNRGALPRQQTLRATVDWSYLLLTESHRRAFERLGVFSSGWMMDAAEAICAGDGVSAEDVFDAVGKLVRKSLVVRIDDFYGTPRYGLLETLREYALEKLTARGNELATLRDRHAAFYTALVQQLDPAAPTTLLRSLRNAEPISVFRVVDAIHNNLRAALKWCLEARRPIEGLVLIRALGPLWQWQGIPPDGPHWVDAVLDLAAAEATRDVGALGDQAAALQAHALFFAATTAQQRGEYRKARELSERSVALWRSLGDGVGLAQALAGLAQDHMCAFEFDQGEAVLGEALTLARAGSQPFTVWLVLFVTASLCRLQGNYERAAQLFDECLAQAQSIEPASYRDFARDTALPCLALVIAHQGDFHKALAMLNETLARMREAGRAGPMLSYCLDWTATVAGRAGDLDRAARLFGAAEAQWQANGSRPMPPFAAEIEPDVRAVQSQLGEQAFARAHGEGRAMDRMAAIAYAIDKPG